MRPVLFAHLETSRLGPVYDGIVHVLISPEDLIPALGMGLLAGQNGPRAARAALFTTPTLWLAASAMAWWLAPQSRLPALPTTGLFILLGSLIAVAWRLPTASVVCLSSTLGTLHGWLNGADMASEGRNPIALLGVAGTIFVLTAISSAHVLTLTAPWSRIAVRVAGSWIAAIGLLMFGWVLRGR
jgi:hydrogenase/urease accessory protein HupE